MTTTKSKKAPVKKTPAKTITLKDLQGVEASPEYLEAVQAEVRAMNGLLTKVLPQIPDAPFMELGRRDKIMLVKSHMRKILADTLERENVAIISK
ncbi:MAG: hypothetical protein EOO38_01675 [Cytophagaceae bacterium]|nr:MAG: hypothetical protein EOO38_01675 [Cytophagaceae bacterium]